MNNLLLPFRATAVAAMIAGSLCIAVAGAAVGVSACGSSRQMLTQLNPPVGTTVALRSDSLHQCSLRIAEPSGNAIVVPLPHSLCSRLPAGLVEFQWTREDSVRLAGVIASGGDSVDADTLRAVSPGAR